MEVDYELLARELKDIYTGATYAYGIYDLRNPIKVGNKLKAPQKDIHTYKGAPKLKHWVRHIKTAVGLGIVPIQNDGRIIDKVRWAVIDIDKYDIDHKPLVKQLKGTPLVPVVSKSGGIHVYAFFSAWVSAAKARATMKAISVKLGHGGCEIFPKQTHISAESGDMGCWVNMPYGNLADVSRYAVDEFYQPLTIEQFITVAKTKRTTLKELSTCGLVGNTSEDHEHVPQGPPCLQFLTTNGFPEGSMNRALLNMGIFFKMAYPDDWEDRVREANKKWFKGGRQEVQNIITSLNKTDYKYMCDEEPMCSHCDRIACGQRKFGVSSTASLPEITELTKVCTTPPTYFMTISDKRVGPVAAEELLNPIAVSRMVFEVTNQPVLIKKVDWLKHLGELMNEVTEVDAPEEVSEYGRLIERLHEFVVSSYTTDAKEEIPVGRVYVTKHNQRLFQLDSFMSYIRNDNFTFKRNQVAAILKQEKIRDKRIKIDGKLYRAWIVENVDDPRQTAPIEARDHGF